MITRLLTIAALAAAFVLGSAVPPAAAEPATPVTFTPGSSASRTSGLGFDACSAPSVAALRAWEGTSPYSTVNIYFGGANRACTQPNLTAAWVRDVSAMDWRLLPTYMGRQPYCMFGNKPYRYTAANAASFGVSDGRDAIAKAKSLGLLRGSALYADVEHYDRTDSSCVTAVRRYVSAWTKTVHSDGYLSGVYTHQDSGIRDLSASYNSTTYARPDAVWMARWDGNTALRDWPTAPNTQWSFHQRAKQYRGDHNETWGGVTINIDSDSLNAPVATVARTFNVTGTTTLNARTGPSTAYPVSRTYAAGAALPVMCQGRGQTVGTSGVWDRLNNGLWVSDYYVSTPSSTGFSAGLPKCTYPGQVTTTSLAARSGPGTSYATVGGPLRAGALAWVMCQTTGTTVGTTAVWNRLEDGRYVSDYHVSNRSNTSWSTPVPRCV